MMRRKIPVNAKIGFSGFLVLVVLAALLLPMAGGLNAAAAVRASAPPMSQEQFLAASKTLLNQLLKGSQSADAAISAGVYTEDAVILPLVIFLSSANPP
jgi:hypothetical protein